MLILTAVKCLSQEGSELIYYSNNDMWAVFSDLLLDAGLTPTNPSVTVRNYVYVGVFSDTEDYVFPGDKEENLFSSARAD